VQSNCGASAFTTATETLRARARYFGEKSPELQEWIQGQDAVFWNCDGSPDIPEELPKNADPLLRADHAYQLAAAHFYNESYEHAKVEFDAISQDAASPWRSIAPYLAARAVARQAAIGDLGDAAGDVPLMHEADRRLQAILKDPSQKQWHQAARKLINLIAYRLEPAECQHRLAREIARGGTGEDFGQDVRDYTLLLDKYLDAEPDFPGVEPYGTAYENKLKEWRRQRYKALQKERSDDLSDWLMTFQSDSKAAWQHAINKWQATKTEPWLFLALAKLEGKDAASAMLLNAAAEVSPTSPTFIAVSYHRVRLLRESGDKEGARQLLAEAQRRQDSISGSTANLLLDEQMKLAHAREGFASLLARQPVRLTYDWYNDSDNGCFNPNCEIIFYGLKNPHKDSPLLTQFDPAGALMLNTLLPTEELVQIVNAKTLPEHLQRRLAPAVWARAALLDQPDLAAKVADAAIAVRPELERFVHLMAEAQSKDERLFVAAFAVAHFPGLRPMVESVFPRETEFAIADDYRDNWWCVDMGRDTEESSYEKQQWPGKYFLQHQRNQDDFSPAFLTPEQAQQAKTEWKIMFAWGGSEGYLPGVLIRWAKAHPKDPIVPEALHFSWRVSRYSCSGENSQPSKDNMVAFKLLHKRYPRSEWTKKTKTWF
jgi:hypothetical protein